MQGLLRLSKGIDAFTEFVGNVTIWLVPLVVAVGVWNVTNRYVGRAIGQTLGSNFYIEAQWYIFSVIFLLGAAYTLKHGEHVRVDVFYGNMSPIAKARVDLFGTLFFLIPFCALLIYFAWPYVMQSWGFLPNGRRVPWEVSPDPGGLPRAPLKTFILISPALLIIQGVSEVIKNLAVLTGHLEPKALADEQNPDLQEV
ncbi:TRAP transporter small permease subunit [Candidatus Viridilinea mediisalina]|uniref:C4-dicarboxylate ABC transporter substrate-binding protein n=1 Tax=Candidatus Viridilinea mediisalina TaxID=2024553 RepID=A0A2A6RHJ6_9CHLR|nr:TRAP transporter small permease subunit [Candidatus Viridilinea mediisalina]PDW02547.1 C4-dicarboxylate ABC transporter substrate-binding protein [Candidatus Viridilinea mediisalina]